MRKCLLKPQTEERQTEGADFCGLICEESNVKNVTEEFGGLRVERSAPFFVFFKDKPEGCALTGLTGSNVPRALHPAASSSENTQKKGSQVLHLVLEEVEKSLLH